MPAERHSDAVPLFKASQIFRNCTVRLENSVVTRIFVGDETNPTNPTNPTTVSSQLL